MMNKLLVIGIAAVVIVAGFIFLFPTGEAEGENIIQNATVTVTEVETGEDYEGTVSLDEPSMSEQMMMSIGQGIRETDLLDFSQNVGQLKGASQYAITVTMVIKVAGTNIASITSNDVEVRGGFAKDGTSYNILHSNSLISESWSAIGLLAIGQTKTITTDGFEYKKPSSGVLVSVTSLLGSDIVNGVTIVLNADVDGLDYNGDEVEASMNAILRLSASLVAGGSLSVEVTSMSSGITQLSMLDADVLMNELDLAKVEA